MTSLEDILGKMTKTRYTYEELMEDDLPEGVDAKRLESYLDDEEFEEIMEISREEFYKLPQWKQVFLGVHDVGWIFLSHDRSCPKHTLQEQQASLTADQEIRHPTAQEDHMFTHRTKA